MIHLFNETLQSLPLKEVYRYMGVKSEHCGLDLNMDTLLSEFLNALQCKACWTIVDVRIKDNLVILGDLSVESAHLAKNLNNCSKAALFAATIGIEADRKIRIAEVRSSVQALVLDAMGSAAI